MNNNTLETLLDNPFTPQTVNPAKNRHITELRDMIQDAKRRDFAAPSGQIVISQDMPENARQSDKFAINLGDTHSFGMSAFCVKQLNQRLSSGFGRYAQELNERNLSDLYLKNVNELLQNDKRQAQVRVLQNGETYARAVVSDKYMKIDDQLVFGAAFNILCQDEHYKRFMPIGGNRTDTKTYCKFVSREPLFEMEIGGKTRAFSAGFMISNSEVGQGNAMFEAFFTDSFCKNGLIFSKSIIAKCKFKHIGSRIKTEFGELTRLNDQINRTRNAEIKALIQEATRVAITQDSELLEQIKSSILASAQRKLEGNETESIKSVLGQVGVNKNDFDNIIKEFDPADDSQFGLQAAITQFAQKVDSYEKRIDLEKRGGDVINLNDRQWSSLQVEKEIVKIKA